MKRSKIKIPFRIKKSDHLGFDVIVVNEKRKTIIQHVEEQRAVRDQLPVNERRKTIITKPNLVKKNYGFNQ